MIFTENELKKWTLKSQKSQIAILLLNQCSISAVFPIVRFAGDQKTALSGESLYPVLNSMYRSGLVDSHANMKGFGFSRSHDINFTLS